MTSVELKQYVSSQPQLKEFREALFILFLWALLIIPRYSPAQDKSAIDLFHRFNAYGEASFVEKIYLHLDKPYYAAGEYMYFRAYLTDMQLDQVSVGSRIIYVELSDGKKNSIRRILLYAEENEFAGQLLLPDSLPSANYHLRAYTNRMRNAGEDYFYHRDIYIGNLKEPVVAAETAASQAYDYTVTFFPEGGKLLAGHSNIESPGWYFSSDEPERAEALDNLLCTQGWARFTWDTLDTAPATYYPEESEFQLTGRLLNKTGSPVRGGEVSLLSNVRNMLPDVSETDEEGRFGFIGFNCPDTAIFILQGRNGRNQQPFFDVRIDTPHVQAPVNIAPLTRAVLPQPAIRTYVEQAVRQKNYEESMWTINLPEIEISTPGKKKEAEQQRIRQGMTGYTIGREQIKDFYSLRDVVRSTPVGIKLERGRPATPPVNRDPLNILVVDGVETDFTEYWNYYEKLPGYMIESMEYVNGIGASMYGARGSGPGGTSVHIINIQMRKSQDIAEMFTTASRPSGLKIYKPEGYCVRKDSYIPAYDNPEIKQNPTPDLRTTICWDPVVETNETGEAEISFYTADQVTTYSYVMEGIGNNQVGFTK
jgi:hypothetical protein